MKSPSTLFNQQHAASYDERFARLAPQREALYQLISILFGDLPERARILCVGVGTGAELIALARAFPGFLFAAVEPAEAMLEICRRRAEEAGIAERCTFHLGYIHTLEAAIPYDAATSLLVSQFLVKPSERVGYFEAIAQRLRPHGWLVNADLAADLDAVETAGLKDFWAKMLRYSGIPFETAGRYLEAWQRDVAVLPGHQVEEMIAAAGFEQPTQIYQSLFIHAWSARRAA